MSKVEQSSVNKGFYIPELDGLRFIAFFLVFIHHLSFFSKIPILSYFYEKGWVGVDLFFILSSFLFTKLLLFEHNKTNRINFGKFYIRRIFRIWPIYFLYISFCLLLYFHEGDLLDSNVKFRIFGLFSFIDNILTPLYGWNPLPNVVHLWTIAFEEQFYIVIPILILILAKLSVKKRIISFICILVVLNLIRISLILKDVTYTTIWQLPITHFDSIIFGVIIGFVNTNILKIRYPIIYLISALLFFVLLNNLVDVNCNSLIVIFTYIVAGLFTLSVLLFVLTSQYAKDILSTKIMVFLGKRSYGLYLYHILGNYFAFILIDEINFLPKTYYLITIYSAVLTLLMSLLSYKFIETPFLKLKKKFEVVTSRPI